MTDAVVEKQAAYISLSLAYDPAVLAIQNNLRGQYGDDAAEWQDPATFHITLCYLVNIEDMALDVLPRSRTISEPIPIVFDWLDIFKDAESQALHIRCRLTPELKALQQGIWEVFQGAEMSEFSNPADYKPHITLAYLKTGVEVPAAPLSGETFSADVLIGREEYEVYAMLPKHLAKKSADDKTKPKPRHFAHRPDENDPATWQLPIHDAEAVKKAIADCKSMDLSAAERRLALSRIARKMHSLPADERAKLGKAQKSDNKVPSNVSNPELWLKCRTKAKSRSTAWPSAWASGYMTALYEEGGGTYNKKKDKKA